MTDASEEVQDVDGCFRFDWPFEGVSLVGTCALRL
jgi:hypothetical protein